MHELALSLLYLQDDSAAAPVAQTSMGLPDIFHHIGPVAIGVLALLAITSLYSWSIILSKWSSFGRARKQSQKFLRAFRKATRLSEVAAVSENFRPSPLVTVFDEIYAEYKRQTGGQGLPRNPMALERSAQIAASETLTRLEERMTWLATIGNIAVYIGLFGTVMGIISAFQGLGTAGASTMRSVAPGIGEALVTTAAGLVVAIPASVAYNQLSARLREFGSKMDDFGRELLNAIESSAVGRE